MNAILNKIPSICVKMIANLDVNRVVKSANNIVRPQLCKVTQLRYIPKLAEFPASVEPAVNPPINSILNIFKLQHCGCRPELDQAIQTQWIRIQPDKNRIEPCQISK